MFVDECGDWSKFWKVGVDDVKELFSGDEVEHVLEIHEECGSRG